MAKLPALSGAKTIRTLETLGFVVMRQSGSHVVLRRGNKGCVVPMHRELKTGTLAGILRQAEISAQEFMEAL
jgi:predicted RNA binding protein YcfA (HicA-like mRNA interferase family)